MTRRQLSAVPATRAGRGNHHFDLALPCPPEWMADALCAQVDTDVFFPAKGGSALPAKEICDLCPVVQACLGYALTLGYDLPGVWGGMSENDRKDLRRSMGGAA